MIGNKLKKLRNQGGFTVIEMITAVFVFSVIMVATGTAFVHTLGLQRRGFGAQKVQENTLFVLETMAREIRVSTIQTPDSNCGLGAQAVLTINHPVNGIVQYSINAGGAITRTVGGVTTIISGQDVTFINPQFCVRGSGIDDKQVRVTIVATVENISTSGRDKVSVPIQTTVSSREVATEFEN
ncbi:MAG: prepilin-type N-terminal cleavage/methylation domain-containing protein [Candidatus Yanofskybacteria bacterium]|nr:prepilin-type N-terminal cleavage/methylation domain-containing protein [Candidatus Yanofskybacteria bacterium]